MNYLDLPKVIAEHYLPKEVKSAKITSRRGEQVYVIYLKDGDEVTWKFSNRLGWYKTGHKCGPHVELQPA